MVWGDSHGAELAVVLGSSHAEAWPDVTVDTLHSAAIAINEHCLVNSTNAYERFVADIQLSNEDRASVISVSVNQHQRTQASKYDLIAEAHHAAGRVGLARAAEAKIALIRSNAERKLLRITQERSLIHGATDIAVGLLRVVP